MVADRVIEFSFGNINTALRAGIRQAGHRKIVWTLPEYDRVSNPQDVSSPAYIRKVLSKGRYFR